MAPTLSPDHLASLLRAGRTYNAAAPELEAYRHRCAGLLDRINATASDDHDGRAPLVAELFGSCGARPWLFPTFRCEFGWNIHLGDRALINSDAVMLDSGRIDIGDDVLIGPRCQFYTADHPSDPVARRAMHEIARPISVGHSVWFGGGVIVLPGVSIGDEAVVGAGAVVTRDVEPGMLVLGTPARPLRRVNADDRAR